MSSDYMPTTEDVRNRYWINDGDWACLEDAAAFDRWLAAHDAEVRRATVDRVLEVLEGQGIGVDSELDNWTFHAPFWAIRRAMTGEGAA